MSRVDDIAAAQTAFIQRTSTALDNVSTDVRSLKTKLDVAVAAISGLTPEQEAKFAEVNAGLEALAGRTEGLAAETPDDPPV